MTIENEKEIRQFINKNFTRSKCATECLIFLYFNKDSYTNREIWENIKNKIDLSGSTPDQTCATEIRRYTINAPMTIKRAPSLFKIVNLESEREVQKFNLIKDIREEIDNFLGNKIINSDKVKEMGDKPYVWQMVKEAVENLGGKAENSEIKDYINNKYGEINESTIISQIIACSVNHDSRIHYPDNNKPRIANSKYDFLYNTERGQVELYDQNKHGVWQIKKDKSGNLKIFHKNLPKGREILREHIRNSIGISKLIVDKNIEDKKLSQTSDAPENLRIYNEFISPELKKYKSKYNKKTPNIILNSFLKSYIDKNGLRINFESRGFPFYGQKVNSYVWACITKKDPEITDRKISHYPQLYILINKSGIKFGYCYGIQVRDNDPKVEIIRSDYGIQNKIINLLKDDYSLKIYSKINPRKLPDLENEIKINDIEEIRNNWTNKVHIIKFFSENNIPNNISEEISKIFDILLELFKKASMIIIKRKKIANKIAKYNISPTFLTFLIDKWIGISTENSIISTSTNKLQKFYNFFDLPIVDENGNKKFFNFLTGKYVRDRTIFYEHQPRRFGCYYGFEDRINCNKEDCDQLSDVKRYKCDRTKGNIWVQNSKNEPIKLAKYYYEIIKNKVLKNQELDINLLIEYLYGDVKYKQKFIEDFNISDKELNTFFQKHAPKFLGYSLSELIDNLKNYKEIGNTLKGTKNALSGFIINSLEFNEIKKFIGVIEQNFKKPLNSKNFDIRNLVIETIEILIKTPKYRNLLNLQKIFSHIIQTIKIDKSVNIKKSSLDILKYSLNNDEIKKEINQEHIKSALIHILNFDGFESIKKIAKEIMDKHFALKPPKVPSSELISILNWIETLPYPLASILWNYHADQNIEHKIEYLFYFFEALSEFIVMIILSSFNRDINFYDQECRKYIKEDPKFRDWFKIPSFGGWNLFGRILTKSIRRIKQNKRKYEKLKELFGRPETEFLNFLINKKLYLILEVVAEYRNQWKGHGGIISLKELKNRLSTLKENLTEIQEVISDVFKNTIFLLPESTTYRKKIFHNQVKKIMGVRIPFEKVKIETYIPIEENKFHLLHGNLKPPIELIPFVRLIKNPETEQISCYFYSRVVRDKIRWVSYHYKGASIIEMPDDDLNSALSLLTPIEKME